jgi:hypothetical protein
MYRRSRIIACAAIVVVATVLGACGSSSTTSSSSTSTTAKPSRGFTSASCPQPPNCPAVTTTTAPPPTVPNGQVVATCKLNGQSTVTWNNPWFGAAKTARIQLTFYYWPPYASRTGQVGGLYNVGLAGHQTASTPGNLSGWRFEAQMYNLDTNQQGRWPAPCT